ncbi:MAG: type II secretion system F family protein [Salaquimonas sp.]
MEISPAIVFSISIVLCVVLAAEAAYLLLTRNTDTKSRINRRMRVTDDDGGTKHDILIQLRKERGMDAEGKMVLPLKKLNKLIVQAGFTIGLKKFMLYYLIYLLMISFTLLILTQSIPTPLLALPFTGLVAPLVWLRMRKTKKLNQFGKQLPEAIELITRSLKAGHPVPVALSMVGREMPDPIGTEFGMVVDEVTYGSDLVTALLSLYERVGHPDLPLLVSSVSIQSTTGGNLREILDSLSKVIRDRLKMKAKIRAISAEGRISAIFLSAMPIILFVVLLVLLPDYYGGIWNESLTWYMFGGLAFWLIAGNLLIMKMVSLKV